MSTIVQKYGGSSLATIDHFRKVARKIASTRDAGNKVAVVLSAMAGETDRLLALSHSFSPGVPSGREQDLIVSTGEQISSALMVMALEERGCPAQPFLGSQIPLRTNAAFTRAHIVEVGKENLCKALNEGKVAVVAGFQGVNERNEITTLGRGGSDTSAVAIAWAIGADICEIYTDVDGVYTADPRICVQARHLDSITYEEMLELAGLGSKVLQARSVELAQKYKVPLLVKSTFGGERCTWIKEEDEPRMEDVIISGITLDRDEAKISVLKVPDEPGTAYRILSPLADAGISIDMIIQNISVDGYTDLTFTVPGTELDRAGELLKEVAVQIGAQDVLTNDAIGKVSIVGIGMKNHPGVAAKMFKALSEENINIQMISTSEIRISCVIEAKYGELAVRVLHDTFYPEQK
ncbi:MAG: aspartate kinase [Firmicutes bacterium]|jgi:aspartate kinase|nr:aspartate kinase [Bacillota bacterium]